MVEICQFLDQQSLLSFALTCRFACKLIIPRLLFSNVSITGPTTEEILSSFCLPILADGSDVGHAVRYIEIKLQGGDFSVLQSPFMLLNAMDKMPNIHGIVIAPYLWHLSTMTRLLASKNHLQDIELNDCPPEILELCRDLARMRRIRFSTDHAYFNFGPGSALETILLNSRETLVELYLDGIIWTYESISEEIKDFSWPAVRTLGIRYFFRRGQHPFDFTRLFPSTRFLELEKNSLATMISIRDDFLSQLQSLDGPWECFLNAVAAGARLRHVEIRASSEPPSLPHQFSLPTSLRSIQLDLHRHFSSGFLQRISPAESLAGITFLCVNLPVHIAVCSKILVSLLSPS